MLGPPDKRTEIGSTEVEHSVFMIYLQELAEEAYRYSYLIRRILVRDMNLYQPRIFEKLSKFYFTVESVINYKRL